MVETRQDRGLAKLARLAAEPRSVVSLWEDVTPVLDEVIPHYTFPCYFTVDPASLLITSHYNPFMPELPRELLALEYLQDDPFTLATVARSAAGVDTVHDAMGGDPTSSRRWQANAALGGTQEMIGALRTRDGATWGLVSLYRQADDPPFAAQDKLFLQQAAGHLAEGTRRALLFGEAHDPDSPSAPGLIVLGEDWTVESSTYGAEQWLAELPDAEDGRLPAAVLTVAGQALRSARNGERPGEVAMARVLSRTGRWVVLHGAALQSGAETRVAVIVEPAHPARITSLLMSAYQLTERERDVTRRVLQGASTTDIAVGLLMSPHTVQQHLKSIFEKTGVRSRRELVGKVFLSHYEPRLRDNEHRVPQQKPLRGGPKDLPPGAVPVPWADAT